MLKKLLILFLFALSKPIFANNIKVEDVKYNKTNNQVSFKISWDNAWRQTEDFHDAAWVFCKYKTVNTAKWLHADIMPQSTSSSGILETKEVGDSLGFFVRLNTDSIGNVLPTIVTFTIDKSKIIGLFPDFKVFAIEMVYVPTGSFWAGDGDRTENLTYNSFYKKNTGTVSKPININSEDLNSEIDGKDVPSQIFETFPKGYDAFYCMKYEVSNEQFTDFLNTIDLDWLSKLGINPNNGNGTKLAITSMLINYTDNESVMAVNSEFGNNYTFGSDCNNNNVLNDSDDCQTQAANISPIWLMNYLYWSGLVPMTELQFEKACKGPIFPILNQQASGTSSNYPVEISETENEFQANQYLRFKANSPVADEFPFRCGMFADSSSDRINSNATFYGILNMGDNLFETCIKVCRENNELIIKPKKSDGFVNHVNLFGSNLFEPVLWINRGGDYDHNGYDYKDINTRMRNASDGIYYNDWLEDENPRPADWIKYGGGRGVRKPN